jgi:hypothetical protein
MTVREKTEILFQFEETNPVCDAMYRGVGIWPFLRLRFLQGLGKGSAESGVEEATGFDTDDAVALSNNGPKREEQKRIRKERQIREWIEAGRETLEDGNDLYLIQASKVVPDEQGTPFHRLFDSLIELTGTRAASRFLYWNDSGAAIDSEELKSPAIPFTSLFGKVRGMSRELDRPQEEDSETASTRGLIRCWNRENPTASVDEDRILQDCESLVRLIGIFQELLAARPRVVFLTCFYSLPAFALAHACRLTGIPCIEMQHGQQGDWHSMYTHRIAAETMASDLLPSHFWAWGGSSRDRMQKWWRPEVTSVHLGGNPWLAFRAGQERPVRTAGTDAGKICLISMQAPGLDAFVVETIISRPDVEWWFRLHPKDFQDRDAFRIQCEEDFGKEIHWEMDRPSSSDLYDLFGEVDLHLTGWSTTAHEAIHFGVPTILIHPNGKSAMDEAITAGVFGYAEDAGSLSQLIDAPPFRCDVEPLMRADRRELMTVFSELVQGSHSVLT